MGLLNSLSKTISVMLQYHIPAEKVSKMLRGQKYEPYGFVQRHPNIKYVSSISDLISKIIDIELGDYSRVQVKPDGKTNVKALPEPEESAELQGDNLFTDEEDAKCRENFNRIVEAKTQELMDDHDEAYDDADSFTQSFIHESAREAATHGTRLYDGSVCPTCSSTRMVQNGTCKVCLDCGTTTGCS